MILVLIFSVLFLRSSLLLTSLLAIVIFLPLFLNFFLKKMNNSLVISGILSVIIVFIIPLISKPCTGLGCDGERVMIILLSFIYLISGFIDKLGLLKKK